MISKLLSTKKIAHFSLAETRDIPRKIGTFKMEKYILKWSLVMEITQIKNLIPKVFEMGKH
jgi:hypothetical protein